MYLYFSACNVFYSFVLNWSSPPPYWIREVYELTLREVKENYLGRGHCFIVIFRRRKKIVLTHNKLFFHSRYSWLAYSCIHVFDTWVSYNHYYWVRGRGQWIYCFRKGIIWNSKPWLMEIQTQGSQDVCMSKVSQKVVLSLWLRCLWGRECHQ